MRSVTSWAANKIPVKSSRKLLIGNVWPPHLTYPSGNCWLARAWRRAPPVLPIGAPFSEKSIIKVGSDWDLKRKAEWVIRTKDTESDIFPLGGRDPLAGRGNNVPLFNNSQPGLAMGIEGGIMLVDTSLVVLLGHSLLRMFLLLMIGNRGRFSWWTTGRHAVLLTTDPFT